MIPYIPPLFNEISFITDFERKAELFIFNPFFAKQYYLVSKISEIWPIIFLKTKEYLSNVTLTEHDKTLLNLNANKAHGHDSINIHMLQICGKSICKPLENI